MRFDSEKASPRRIDDPRVRTLLAAVVLVAIAWVIYRPDRLRPFHIIDFSEFIPILLQGDGVADNTRRVIEYYASQGRFNVIPYVLLAAKWDLFSWWTPGWQIARAVLMVTLFGLTYVLLRRLGASRLGGLVGGSVYLWSPAAADGWVRMTIAEPLGAAIMLVLSIRAVKFQRVEGWRREIAWMAVGTMALIWTKELMAPLVLLPIGLALTRQPNGRFAFPRPTRRNTMLVVWVATAAVLALIPIALFYLRAEEAAYASMYGRGIQSPSGLLAIWVTMLVPFLLIIVPANFAWALAVSGLVLLVAVGWRVGFRGLDSTNRARWLLAFALFVPLAGLLAYLPNPWYATFYTLPYLIGSALLIGMGATWLQETGRKGEFLAVGAWMGILLHGATSSAVYATRTDAVQRRDEWVIRYVADSVRADSVQFATKTPPPYDWLGFGAAMSRISRAKGHPWPPTRNISCAEAREHLTSKPGMLTVNLESSCRFEGPRLKVISQEFRRLDMRRLELVVDSAHADIVLPTGAHVTR
jgi:hypothetical protein